MLLEAVMAEETKCKCPAKYLVGVEYSYDSPEHYDGVSEWDCSKCGNRVGRWTGRLLTGMQCEPRYGRFATEKE